MVYNDRGYDVVIKGQVIGPMLTKWQLVYDDRPQGQPGYADGEEAAKAAATTKMNEFKSEFCGFPCYLYPDDSKWTVRIYV